MPEYAVLSRRVLTGTISDLPPSARIAWITILFEAEKLRGRVKLPIRDLAKMASITTPEAAEALQIFQDPDPYSSSQENEGRRLLPVAGETDWFVVTTWEKHAEERAQFFNRLRQQRHRSRNAASRDVTESNGVSRDVTKEPELEPEPKKETESETSRPRRKAPSDTLPRFADDSTEMKAARYLFEKMRANNAGAKEPNWQAWARDIDLTLRVDHRDKDELRRVIDWCQADSFWLSNVLSPATLRKQYERLVMAMKQPQKAAPQRKGPAPHPLAPHLPPFTN